MNNPMQMLKGMKNPKEMCLNMMSNNNPMLKNLFELAQKNDVKSVENFARNFYKERGLDFDKEFGDFMKNFK